MNKGGGEKARAAKAAKDGGDSRRGGRGGGGRSRGGVTQLRKGVPLVPTAPASATSGNVAILNTRIAIPGEKPPLPPRRAPRPDTNTPEGETTPTSGLRGWRGLGPDGAGASAFDGLGIVPGGFLPGGSATRAGAAPAEVLHMTDDAQDAVSDLLRDLRPAIPTPPDPSSFSARVAAEEAARKAASLAAPSRVAARASGLASVDAGHAGRAALFASSDAVLDQLAAQEVHAVRASEAAAREGARRAARARVRRERERREDRLARRLTDRGFDREWAERALAHCAEDAEAFDRLDADGEVIRSNPEVDDDARRAATDARMSAALDWLCLHAPKEKLPEAFKNLAAAARAPRPDDAARAAEENAALAANKTNASADEDHATIASLAPTDPYVALLQRAMLGRLGAYGFSRAESREALEAAGWVEEDATYALLRGLYPENTDGDGAEEGGGGVGAMSEEEALAERGEEALALEAIFDDAFRDFTRDDGAGVAGDADAVVAGDDSSSSAKQRMWTVRVATDDDRWSACHLEVHFPPGCRYPAEPPLLSLRQPNLSPPIRRSVVAQLAAQAASLTGEAVVYTLAAWLQEHLPAVLEEHGEMDEEAAARAAAAAAEEEARREAEAAERAEVRLSGHSKFERTFARLEAREEAEKREEEERKKRMAYFRQLLAAEKEAERTKDEDEDDEVEDDEVEDEVEVKDEVDADATAASAAAESHADGSDPDLVSDPDLDSDLAGGLDAKLRRWEARHAARVEAAKVATRAAEEVFFARRVVQPNVVVTKAQRAAEKAAAEREAAEKAAVAAKAAASETSKGRRAAARERLYAESARAAAENAAGDAAGTFSSTKKLSWLTKHVKSMGLGDEERDGATVAATTTVAGASEDDEVAAAAAATLAGAGGLLSAKPRAEADAEAKARRVAETSARLAEAERRKETDPRWREMQTKRSALPACAMREEVLRCIDGGRASVVSGATGCGKTTQVPQFVFEEAIRGGRGGECSVIITQPRRLSAIAVAERVAAERCERVGDTVGYSIRLESKQSRDTRLLFCTTGILLRRLQSDPDLEGVSHVIVDEVHERDLLSDFLLVILRRLAARRDDFRLVAMSATVNAELFQSYFEKVVPGPCGCVEIPGRTFPVAEYRLEDAIEATGYVCEPDSEFAIGAEPARGGRGGRVFGALSGGGARDAAARAATLESLQRTQDCGDVTDETRAMYPGYADTTLKCLQTVDEEKINFELIELLVALIADEYEEGAILIFLPGMAEIRGLHERLLGTLDDVERRFLLIPLHSTLSSEEQRLTFSKPPRGVRKVVMATNIAETSITIDDVVFVIDSGRVRETQYDPVSRMSSLVTAWCSRASSRQRRGRAGRVREGYCFHLYSSARESSLADFTTPEILRTPLDALCLQIKVLRLGDVREFLAQAIEPPPEGAIASALRSLMELDAVDAADELTPLGHHLAELPVDARLGKMMLYGAMFSCLDPVLTIAASVGFRSPFLAPMDKRDEADEAKRKLAGHGATSDHLTLVRAYAGWIRAKARGRAHERDFLAKAFLSAQTLRQISEMRQQYVELLDQIGFLRSGAGLLGGKAEGRETEGGQAEGHETKGGETKGCETKTERDESTVEKTPTTSSDAAGATASSSSSNLAATAAPFVPKPKRAPPPRDAKPTTGRRGRAAAAEAALLAASVNAGNEPLVRAVICAGLFPNVAVVEGRGGAGSRPGGSGAQSKVVVRTKGDGEVSLHPTSVCFGLPSFEHRFLLFHEKVKTTKVYVRDATMVGPYPLLLFGGKVKVDHERASALCDGWIRFRAAPRVAVLFKALRAELDGLLMQKIAAPELNIAKKSGDLVETIVELLESERAVVAEARAEERRAEEARRAEKA